MSERELKEQKAIKGSVANEQYQYKFPDDERHFGFENVSAQSIVEIANISYLIV